MTDTSLPFPDSGAESGIHTEVHIEHENAGSEITEGANAEMQSVQPEPTSVLSVDLVQAERGTRETTAYTAVTPRAIPDHLTLAMAAEDLVINRETVVTDIVRIQKNVDERIEMIHEPIYTETLDIREVMIGQVVETIPPTRFEGDVMIVPVVEEEIVIQKRLVLKSELHVTKVRGERNEPLEVTLRRERISIQHIDPTTGLPRI